MPKLRVGVLMGGKTIEREVSFNSGRTICNHLDTARYEVIPLFQTEQGNLYILPWQFLPRGKISDFAHRLEKEAQLITWDDLKELIDFAYIAIHGRYAEDGTLQGILEVLRIPYLGSKVFASALGMDKIMQKDFLKAHDIDYARGITVSPTEILNFDAHKKNILEKIAALNIQYPVIVKPYKEGSSLGVSVVQDETQIHHALLKACTIYPEKHQPVLVEEKLQGMEFSCVVITDNQTGKLIPMPPTEIVHNPGTQFYDYEQKYMPGKSQKFTPARCDAKTINAIQQISLKVMSALGFSNIGRIDGFVTSDNRIAIIDPNSLSGMGPTSYIFRQAAELNISHTQLINHLIETELQSYQMFDAIIAQEKKDAQNMNIKKIRVAVLMGGASNEKEISLETGRNITYKLSPQKYEVIPIFVTSTMHLYTLNQAQLVSNNTQVIEQSLKPEQKLVWHDLKSIADFVFIGLHGGEGENGSVQGTLEMLEIPYNGSGVLTSALCMDKYKTTHILKSKGFEVPHSLLISKSDWITRKNKLIEKIITDFTLPVIIKPHDDGCSVMVQKVKKEKELSASIDLLFDQGKNFAMIEECIVGMELTVGVIGNDNPRALIPSQAVATADILSIEEKFLPGAGENQTPAPLPKETLTLVQSIVEQAYAALGCKGYSRVDCFFQDSLQSPTGKERVVILENNSLPGMTPATCIFHQAAEMGIKPMDFIDLIVQLGFEEHAKIKPSIELPIKISVQQPKDSPDGQMTIS
jgi:D-alanine--D-alanine ligase